MKADQTASSTNGVVVEETKGLPSWLKPSVFLQADFQAEEYVSYLRRFVSALCSHDPCQQLLAMIPSKLHWTGPLGNLELRAAEVYHCSQGKARGSDQRGLQ